MSGSFQSHNYVLGVSGWKVDNKGVLVLNDGNQRVIAKMLMVTTAGPGQTNDQAAQAVRDAVCDERKLDGPKTVPPFIVVDGITYIREAEVDLLTVGALASRVTSVEGDIASILQAFRAACPNH